MKQKVQSRQSTVSRRWIIYFIATTVVLGSAFYLTQNYLHHRYYVGQAIDSLHGVVVYYNGSVNHTGDRNVAPDGYNIGLKYQCVEFVKRYYYQHLKHKMPDSYGNAVDFFDKKISDGNLSTRRNLLQFNNGSSSKPHVSDLIIFSATSGNPYGHVAIVSAVFDDEIEIIQQNPGSTASSRKKMGLDHQNGKWEIQNTRVLGWLRKGK